MPFILSTTGFLLSFLLTTAVASDIRAQQYDYGYGDSVKAMTDDAFLVCDECKDDKLSRLPRQIVAIKMTPPESNYENPVTERVSEPLKAEKKCELGCLMGTIRFPLGSAKIQKAERKKMDDIYKSIPAGAKLFVTGYTCAIGTRKYNRKLSERRAKRVAAYLVKKGARIGGIEGKGECCPVSNIKSHNRRVEIIEKENQ